MSVVASPATTQPNPDHVLRLAAELNIKVFQVAATAQLFAEGATVPFIARYRKEVTGELDEVQVFAIRDRLELRVQLRGRQVPAEARLDAPADAVQRVPDLVACVPDNRMHARMRKHSNTRTRTQ